MKKILYCVLALFLLVLIFAVFINNTDNDNSPVKPVATETVEASSPPENTPTANEGTAQTLTPSNTPSPPALQTEEFTCEYFSVTKPVGWNVCYDVYDAGGGQMRLLAFAVDPEDNNNIIFYAQALEPFFPSLEAKNAALPYLSSEYEWAPVFLEGVDAENVIKNWAAFYTMMESSGFLSYTSFKNYLVQSVLQTYYGGTYGGSVVSGALAEVSIPAADTNYALFFEGVLTPTPFPNSAYSFYISNSNYGFVANPELFNSSCDILNSCKNSFDLSGFQREYGVCLDDMPSFSELGEFKLG